MKTANIIIIFLSGIFMSKNNLTAFAGSKLEQTKTECTNFPFDNIFVLSRRLFGSELSDICGNSVRFSFSAFVKEAGFLGRVLFVYFVFIIISVIVLLFVILARKIRRRFFGITVQEAYLQHGVQFAESIGVQSAHNVVCYESIVLPHEKIMKTVGIVIAAFLGLLFLVCMEHMVRTLIVRNVGSFLPATLSTIGVVFSLLILLIIVICLMIKFVNVLSQLRKTADRPHVRARRILRRKYR